MKKSCKTISILVILIILFNFIFCGFVYADDDEESITYSEESFNELVDTGTVSIQDDTEEVSETTSSTASTVGTETSFLASMVLSVTTIIRIFANSGGFYYTESEYSAANIGWFSINSLVFGEYLLFNANVFQTNKDLNPDVESTSISEKIDSLKENVAGWFQILRLVAIALIIVLLIFTGLRLALSDLAEDRARYKEVIKAWLIGLFFIGLLPYIISAMNVICDKLMDIFWNARLKLENNDYASFENNLFLTTLNGTANTGGLKSAVYFIEFAAFVIMDIKFLAKYIMRSFRIFMLVFFSPMIGILHILNKIRGKDGTIGNWFSKYFTNLFMQPLHALLYLIFMFTASNIALNAPLLAIVFLWALSRAEKIFGILLEIDYGKIKNLFSR